MTLYKALKSLVPLPVKVAAHEYLRRLRTPRPFRERRACLQLYQPLRAPHPAVRLARFPSFSLYAPTTGYIGQEMSDGRWEPHVTRVLEGLLKEGDTFLDIGANVGYFTLLAARLVGPGGRVLAFEPNPQTFQLLCASVIENGVGNVTLYPLAASDSEAVLKLVAIDSNAGVINPWSVGQDFHFLAPSARLDDLLHGRKVDALKIDVEGHEPAALMGMEELIRQHRPAIVTEFHPWVIEMNNREEPATYLRQLISYGYRLSIIKYSGELLDAAGENDVMDYWRSLGEEKSHLDLLARPA